MALKRSQKAIEQDPEVVLRIGVNHPIIASKQDISTTFETWNSDRSGSKSLVQGWRIIEKKFDTHENIKKSCMVAPFVATLSRSKPNIVIRKRDNVDEKTLDNLIKFLKEVPFILDRNDPTQWDPISESPIGERASAEWFFEDMRLARKQRSNLLTDNLEISAALHAMKGNERKLRDALFLIGESPIASDTEEDLFFILLSNVMEDPKSEARRKFLKYFVNPEMTQEQKDVQIWLNKGISFNVVEDRNGFLVFQTERMGTNEKEAVEHLLNTPDLLKALKVSVSNKSGLKEDIETANEVVEKVNGSADTARAIAAISDKMKTAGLSSRPDLILKGIDTVKEAVAKYNAKAKENNLPKSAYITEDGILAEIGVEA